MNPGLSFIVGKAMRTLRIVSREDPPRPVEGHGRTQEVEASPPAESDGRRGEVPIRLESLPTPLRAVVRDHGEGGLRIEAELPWLSVGTVVHAAGADGVERTGRVQSFDVELTGEGSARLLIFTAPEGADVVIEPPAQPGRPPQATRRRSPLLIAALVLGSAVSGYVARSFLGPARPAAATTMR
jgi:hypothetical protein